MKQVTLNNAEILQCSIVGICRKLSAIGKKRYDDTNKRPGEYWTADITGAIGEYVVARFLGLFWDGTVGSIAPGDIGTVEVRATYRADGCLIIKKNDNPDSFFYLVIVDAMACKIFGPIKAARCKLDKFWRTNVSSPAFFVPQNIVDNADKDDG